MTFSKHEKWGSEKLNLSVQTSNELPIRRPVERPRKIVSSASSGLAQTEPAAEPATEHAPQPAEKALFNELNQAEDHMNIDEKRVYDDPDSDSFTDEEISDGLSSKKQSFRQESNPPTRKSARQKAPNYLNVFVPKRKRSGPADEKKITEHRVKITRAMTTLLTHDAVEGEANEWAFSAKSDYDSDHENKLVIPVPETYEQAIKDSV